MTTTFSKDKFECFLHDSPRSNLQKRLHKWLLHLPFASIALIRMSMRDMREDLQGCRWAMA